MNFKSIDKRREMIFRDAKLWKSICPEILLQLSFLEKIDAHDISALTWTLGIILY